MMLMPLYLLLIPLVAIIGGLIVKVKRYGAAARDANLPQPGHRRHVRTEQPVQPRVAERQQRIHHERRSQLQSELVAERQLDRVTAGQALARTGRSNTASRSSPR